MSILSWRRGGVSLLLGLGLVGGPAGVQAQTFDYSQGHSHIPYLYRPYTPPPVPQPTLANSPRVNDLIRQGKLYLSLQDTIYLALENNLDIAVARYEPFIAASELLRARGGFVTGTGIGPFGVSGAALDGRVSSNLWIERSRFPLNNPFLTGAGTLAAPKFNRNLATGDFSYTQGFTTGTAFRIGYESQRSFTNPSGNLFNHNIQTGLSVAVSQPLTNGFGFAQNARAIRVAKNNRQISDQTFAQQVMDIVSRVKTAYWELIFAREDVKVKEQSLALAEKLYRDNKRQVEIGTLAPIEVVRAESEVARTRQDLIVSQTSLLQQQIVMKDLVSKNPTEPLLALIEIEPTDRPDIPDVPEVIPVQDAIQIAMERRPEVISAQLDIQNRNLDTKAARNALLPSVEAFAFYTGVGLSGLGRFCADPRFSVSSCPVPPTVAESTGLGRSVTRAWQGDFPDYGFGINISLPIKNRVAQADAARAEIAQRQSETRYRRTVNSIVVEVRNAQIALEQNRARIDAAIKSRQLFEETLNAEEKKFQLGASTIFQVIQAQRDLAQARSLEVRALVDFKRTQVDFDRALGRTLERSNISLDDAKTGVVTARTSSGSSAPF
ncbi:MAG: TolC family protein [Acidobacteria bacterium]|nr:TolC family protein [Acidobacteriota bacterium]